MQGNRFGCRGNNGWQAKRLPYNNQSDADGTFPSIDDPPASSPNASPSPTPTVFSPQTLAELKQLQKLALESDYAYRQVAHLANNIGPRLSGSAQAAKAVDYVASELKAIGCEVQLEKVMVPHWVRGEETAALVQFPGQAPNTKHNAENCPLRARVKRRDSHGWNRSRRDRRPKF